MHQHDAGAKQTDIVMCGHVLQADMEEGRHVFQEGNAFTLEALQHQVSCSAPAFCRLLKRETMAGHFSKQQCSMTGPHAHACDLYITTMHMLTQVS